MLLASLPLHQVKGLATLLKTNLEKGIEGDDTDLVKRKNAFGANVYPRKKGRSFWVIFITNLIFYHPLCFIITITFSFVNEENALIHLFIYSFVLLFLFRCFFGKLGKTSH